MMSPKQAGGTRYALVGIGSSATMYIGAICGKYKECCELVALCDTSLTGIAYDDQRLMSIHRHPQVPHYSDSDFDVMLDERNRTSSFF